MEFKSPDDLYAYAAEKDAEARALDAYRKQAAEHEKRARELEALTKDPRRAITPEIEHEILQRKIQEWREEEALRAMPEDQRRIYLFARQQEQEKAALAAKLAEREAADAEAKKKAEAEAAAKLDAEQREEMKALIGNVLQQAGLEPTIQNVQRVSGIMYGAAQRGVVYPPEVIAKKVREAVRSEHAQVTSSLAAGDLLSLPGLVEKLNALDDASLLRKLAPLGDKLRRLNLESLGARAATAPNPVVTRATGTDDIDTSKLSPGDPAWEEVLQRRLKG